MSRRAKRQVQSGTRNRRIPRLFIRRSAFTLIELLVVVAIISLLVAILLPSLQQAKELARTVECATHLRSIHLAVNFYAEDWEGWLVPEGYGAARYEHAWTLALAPYLNVSLSDMDGNGYIPPRGESGSAYIYQCPRSEDNTWYGQNIFYGINWWGLTGWGHWLTVKVDDVKPTSILFGDYQCKGFWNSVCTDGAYPASSVAMGPVHPMGYNYLFGAGNVESVESTTGSQWENFDPWW
jgi:prepilin-type N-terminal cleavage/methylation domain-containing protein